MEERSTGKKASEHSQNVPSTTLIQEDEDNEENEKDSASSSTSSKTSSSRSARQLDNAFDSSNEVNRPSSSIPASDTTFVSPTSTFTFPERNSPPSKTSSSSSSSIPPPPTPPPPLLAPKLPRSRKLDEDEEDPTFAILRDENADKVNTNLEQVSTGGDERNAKILSSTPSSSPSPGSSKVGRTTSSSSSPSSTPTPSISSSSSSASSGKENLRLLTTDTSPRDPSNDPSLFDVLNFSKNTLAPPNRINNQVINPNALGKPSCGNGFCESGETCETCPLDCGSLVSSYVARCDLGIQRCMDTSNSGGFNGSKKTVVVKVTAHSNGAGSGRPSSTSTPSSSSSAMDLLEHVSEPNKSKLLLSSQFKREFLPFLQPTQDLNILLQHPGLRSFSYVGFSNNISSALTFFTQQGFEVIPIDLCLFGRTGPFLVWETAFHVPLD
ncbi:hypothetical protein HMI56_000555 [Coelomomyces lativittatus]|nr:hypothetical protein HMI56_000555 [Coelomomyces lativittatus]